MLSLPEFLIFVSLACAIATGFTLWLAKKDGRALIENLSDAILVVDEKGRALRHNVAFGALCGDSFHSLKKTRRKIYLRHIVAAWANDSYLTPVCALKLKKKLKSWSEEPFDFVLAQRTLTLSRKRLPSGKCAYIFSTPCDREDLVQALNQSKEDHKTLLENSPSPLMLLTLEGEILFANALATHLLEMPKGERVLTQNFAKYLPFSHDSGALQTLLEQAQQNEQIVQLQTASELARWVRLSAQRITQNEIPILSVVLIDMSEHYKAQAELEEKQRDYLDLVDLAPRPITIFDAQGKELLFSNQCARALFGISPSATEPPVLFENETQARSLFASVRAKGERFECEVRMLCAQNEPRWMELALVRTSFAGKEAVFCSFRDIDEQRVWTHQMLNAFSETEVQNRLLHIANMELEQLASTDRLTRAFNRRHFEEVALREMSRARRYGMPLAIIMLDIDHFKKVNDNYGHEAGDKVLKSFAARVRTSLRSSDVLARWGGEEFIVLATSSTEEEAALLAEKLRALCQAHQPEDTHPITISAGVTGLNFRDTLDTFIHRADTALYRAKEKGRNKVCIESSETAHSPLTTSELLD